MDTETPQTPAEPAAETPAPESSAPAPFDEKSVPPELQGAYTHLKESLSKTLSEETKTRLESEYQQKYAGYEDFKKSHESFTQLAQNPKFIEWYNAQNAPAAPPIENLTPEKLMELQSDPAKFQDYLQKREERIKLEAAQSLEPRIRQAQHELSVMQWKQHLEAFAQKHPDFDDLNKSGKIAAVLDRYKNVALNIEDVYKLAKYDSILSEAQVKAQARVEEKKRATAERGGVSSSSTLGRMKVKNRAEAMEIALDYAKQGKPTPDFDFASTR